MELVWLLRRRCKNCVCDSACRETVNCNTSIWLEHESLHTHAQTHTHLLHSLHGRWWILVAAEVNNDPGDVAEKGDGD